MAQAARQLRLGPLDEALVRRALGELAEAAFGSRDGIVRLQASRDGEGGLHLVGVPRPLAPDPAEWSAILVRPPHDGGGLAPGLKVSSRLTLALAGDAARGAGADEALLVDAEGWLVEGARSNIVVVPEGAGPATPPLDRGAVAGIARDVVLERVPEIAERDVAVAELGRAREIVAVNAVRGARPITRLEDAPAGDGRAGPWAERLAAVLARD
jgi:branched-subunit amino acid aminotransferase/4-amino-4-deoxychorismate lyase